LVPTGAGVGSAIGFLRAPFSFEANRSVYMKLSDFKPAVIKSLLTELQDEATGFVRSCDAVADIISEFKVYMRYTGQGWEIPISLSAAQAMSPDADTFLKLFEADYEALFGRTVDGMDVEITVWSVNATTPPEQVAQIALATDAGVATATGQRELFDPALAAVSDAKVVLRDDMMAGQTVQGPAVVTEDETTIIVPSSRQVKAQPDGTIDMTTKGAAL
jgi:N-methylhydantoinase A